MKVYRGLKQKYSNKFKKDFNINNGSHYNYGWNGLSTMIWTTPSLEYAKRFGKYIIEYEIDPKEFFDLTKENWWKKVPKAIIEDWGHIDNDVDFHKWSLKKGYKGYTRYDSDDMENDEIEEYNKENPDDTIEIEYVILQPDDNYEKLNEVKYRSKEFAKEYAMHAHNAYTPNRKSTNAPYFTHPHSVCDLLEGYGASEDELIVAALHDSVEDCPLTIKDIEETFGTKIAELVSELTNSEDHDGLEKEDYMNKKLVNMSSEALTVKLGDMTTNLLDSPRPKQVERMMNNIRYLINNRRIEKRIHKNLIEAFNYGYVSYKRKSAS